MECVWPEVKSFERASSQRSASSSPDLTPSSAGPSTTAAQLLNDLNSTNTSHLFAPHTEQSAVDGLMDLFAANHTDTSHTNAFNHPSNGSIPSISPTVPMQPFQYPSSLSLPSHSLPHPHVSAGELFGGNDIFSFDDVSLDPDHLCLTDKLTPGNFATLGSRRLARAQQHWRSKSLRLSERPSLSTRCPYDPPFSPSTGHHTGLHHIYHPACHPWPH